MVVFILFSSAEHSTSEHKAKFPPPPPAKKKDHILGPVAYFSVTTFQIVRIWNRLAYFSVTKLYYSDFGIKSILAYFFVTITFLHIFHFCLSKKWDLWKAGILFRDNILLLRFLHLEHTSILFCDNIYIFFHFL